MRPLIQGQLNGYGRQLDNYEEAIEKTIDVKTKATCQPLTFVNDIDSRCIRGYWPLRTNNFEKDVEAKKFPPPSSVNYISKQSS